uniref:Uncharacterized protein n=1 Tax=Toxoplasma gondii (strain ATCC 50861 / VEG) TaxID=432359 RepID=A0A0F7V676_TOXGV|nr:TPA: hypothetical protein BN1205_007330 [Toxoplasma gondii VEG]
MLNGNIPWCRPKCHVVVWHIGSETRGRHEMLGKKVLLLRMTSRSWTPVAHVSFSHLPPGKACVK